MPVSWDQRQRPQEPLLASMKQATGGGEWEPSLLEARGHCGYHGHHSCQSQTPLKQESGDGMVF